jgi:hypothetical protein
MDVGAVDGGFNVDLSTVEFGRERVWMWTLVQLLSGFYCVLELSDCLMWTWVNY